MNIAIGADHRGLGHKEYLQKQFNMPDKEIHWIDIGAFNENRSDYPIFAQRVCLAVLDKKAECGILLCGTGVGMAIAANRYKGIYAALAWNTAVARLSKEDDKANVLVVPSDYVSLEQSCALVQAWLNAEFRSGRYQERIAMIDALVK